VSHGRDPRRAVDVQPDVVIAEHRGLTGVEPHADFHCDAIRPWMRSQRSLRCHRRLNRRAGGWKDDEERIALGADLVAAGSAKDATEQLTLGPQHIGISVLQVLDEPRGAFDVGEDECDRPGR
jgi:hypothetical protein